MECPIVRPQIPQALVERMNQEAKFGPLYKQAGYNSRTALVNDAVREKLNELEEEYTQ